VTFTAFAAIWPVCCAASGRHRRRRSVRHDRRFGAGRCDTLVTGFALDAEFVPKLIQMFRDARSTVISHPFINGAAGAVVPSGVWSTSCWWRTKR
jgi:hypothetical protein